MGIAEFVIAFREFFEIAAVLGVMFAYLHKTGRGKLCQYVWAGALAAAGASIIAAGIFSAFSQAFEKNEPLFEGITLLVAACFVTWLIFWMFGTVSVSDGIRRGMKRKIDGGKNAGLALFAFVAVLREGIEIVLFLAGIRLVAGQIEFAWVVFGAGAAVALAWAMFSNLVRLDIAKFFIVTGVLLVLMAGGMAGQGVSELSEAGILPPIVEHVYDVNPPLNMDGSYPPLHEMGIIGSTLKTLVGYDANPSLMQLVAQLSYYALAYGAYRRIGKMKALKGRSN
jgi:high-affinity iron transporter